MSRGALLVVAMGLGLLAAGGMLAFWRPGGHLRADTTPGYYRRMISGTMLGAFGLIITVFAVVFSFAG